MHDTLVDRHATDFLTIVINGPAAEHVVPKTGFTIFNQHGGRIEVYIADLPMVHLACADTLSDPVSIT